MSKRWKARQAHLTRKAGTPNGEAGPAPPPEIAPGREVPLTDEERSKMGEFETGITRLKCLLADRLQSLREAESLLSQAQTDQVTFARSIVSAHGGDPNDTSTAWHADFQARTIKRVK